MSSALKKKLRIQQIKKKNIKNNKDNETALPRQGNEF